MCADILCSLLVVLGASSVSSSGFDYMTVSAGVIDVEVNGAGDVYVLLPGLPHLQIYSTDGNVMEFDLSEVLLPGGICIDERWGWFVTGELTDMVYHYDRTGELRESWESLSRPGDICLYGLFVLYVARAGGTVCRLDDSDIVLVNLGGSGEGQLSASENRAVYSCGSESFLFGSYSAPEQLPAIGTWLTSRGELIVLQDSCVMNRNGTTLYQFPGSGEYSRMSCSANGNHCLLWSPGSDRILVFR